MNKRHIKLIMELIFIFILPLIFICFTSEIQVERNFEYDNQGNYEVSQDTKSLSFDNSIIKYQNIKPMYLERNYNTTQIVNVGINDYTNNMLVDSYPDVLIFQKDSTYTDIVLKYYYTKNDIDIEIDYYFNYGRNDPKCYGYIYDYNTDNEYYTYTYNAALTSNITNQDIKNNVITDTTHYFNMELVISEIIPIINTNYNLTIDDLFTMPQNEQEVPEGTYILLYEEQKITNTIWGNIKELLITNLDLNDNILLDIVLCYMILWIIHWIIWHLFYGFLELLIHIIPRKWEADY